MTSTEHKTGERDPHVDGLGETPHWDELQGAGRLIGRINEYSRSVFGVHPYHVMFNSGLVAITVFAVLFSWFVHEIRLAQFLIAFVVTTVTYEFGFLKVKRSLLGIDTRSYLQDLVAFILPVWIGVAVALGVDFRATLALIGLQFPILIGFIRIGCVLGGCCYGVPSKYGIRYPSIIFRPHQGSCQSFSPGDNPHAPVFPIQLVESGVNFLLFGVLFVRILVGGVDGLTLPLYLLGYSIYRFASDFFRASSARPHWGPLSEAQWFSLGSTLLITAGLAAYGALPFSLP